MRRKSNNWTRRRPAQEVNINKVREEAYAEALELVGYYDTVEEVNISTTLQLTGFCSKCVDDEFTGYTGLDTEELLYVVKLCSRTKHGKQINVKRHVRKLRTGEAYESIASMSTIGKEVISVLAHYVHFNEKELQRAELHLQSNLLKLHMSTLDRLNNTTSEAEMSCSAEEALSLLTCHSAAEGVVCDKTAEMLCSAEEALSLLTCHSEAEGGIRNKVGN